MFIIVTIGYCYDEFFDKKISEVTIHMIQIQYSGVFKGEQNKPYINFKV